MSIIRTVQTLIGDEASYSLLPRDESNAVKGLLILLIVLGHNKYLMNDGYSFQFLYSFHVYSFYFLSFLYDYHKENWVQITRKNLRRLYVPYTFFFLILVLICLIQGHNWDLTQTIVAFVTGTQFNLRGALQYGGFLWFIPTLFSLLMIKTCYYSYPRLRLPLILGSAVAWIAYAFLFFVKAQIYAPCSCFLGYAMLLPALLSRLMVTKVSLSNLCCAFLFLVIAILVIYPSAVSYKYWVCNRILCPVIIFSLLVKMRSAYCRKLWIQEYGRYSFQIYLIHVFLYNGAYSIIAHYNLPIGGHTFGLVLFLVVSSLSLWLGRLRFWRYIFLQ